MIRHIIGITAIAGILTLSACEEIPPTIQLDKYPCDNPPVSPQSHHVLIEEFTGVRCVNCPDGAAEIAALKNQLQHNLVAVSIHTGFYSVPYPDATQDLSFGAGTAFTTLYGNPQGYPAAIVDRKLFDGQSTTVINRNLWAGSINNQLQSAAPVSVEINNAAFDPVTQNVNFQVNLACQAGIKKDIALSVMLTERDIVQPQLTSQGINTNYTHQHVLRQIIPNVNGAPIAALPFTQQFSIPVDGNWNPDKLNIVAVVHYFDLGNSDFTALQVEEVEL